MKNQQRTELVLVIAAIGLLLTGGCGKSDNVSGVTGTITLAGEPLSKATVTFIAQESRNVARAITDANGRYRLLYSPDVEGAEVGGHRVSITTYSSGDPDGDPPLPKTPEKIPAKYNARTELTVTVTPGNNVIDFALVGEGLVIQPDTPTVLR